MKKNFETRKRHEFNTLIRKLNSLYNHSIKSSKAIYFQNVEKNFHKKVYIVDNIETCRKIDFRKIVSRRQTSFFDRYFVTKSIDSRYHIVNVCRQKVCYQKSFCKQFIDRQKLFRKFLVDCYINFCRRFDRFDAYLKSINFTTFCQIDKKKIMIVTRAYN